LDKLKALAGQKPSRTREIGDGNYAESSPLEMQRGVSRKETGPMRMRPKAYDPFLAAGNAKIGIARHAVHLNRS
jgi:hypothetical protein